MRKAEKNRSYGFLVRPISYFLFAACLILLIWMSLSPKLELETLASMRYDKWANYWQKGASRLEINLDKDLLPSVIPGPLDNWAKNKPHSLILNFELVPNNYLLNLLFFETHEAAPPEFSIKLNGKDLGKIQALTGKGQPAPYLAVNKNLNLSLPLKITQKSNQLIITSNKGSWAALAKLRFTHGYEVSLAKAGYLFLTKPFYPLIFLSGILLGIFLFQLKNKTLPSSLASTLLLSFSFFICFIIIEVGYRAYLIKIPQARRLNVQKNYAPQDLKGMNYSFGNMITPNPDMEITYQLKADLDGYFTGKPLKTNSHHMRGPEVTIANPGNTFRIMGLGDSVLFGWGVEYSQTALVQAAKILQKNFKRPVESLNLACPSYNTSVEVACYKKIGRKFKPDVVVLLFVENDFEPPSMMFEPVTLWNTEKSYVIEQIRRALALKWQDAESESEDFYTTEKARRKAEKGQKLDRKWRNRLEAYYNRMAGKKAVAQSLNDLAKMLKQDSVKGIVVYGTNRIVDLDEKTTYVLSTAKEYGLEVIDMTPIYKDWLEKHNKNMKKHIWVHPKDPHPNKIGHRLIGRAIAERIEAKSWCKRFPASTQ